MLHHKPVLKLYALGIVVSATIGSAMAQQAPQQNPTPPSNSPPVQQPINGEFIRTNQVLGIPSSYCGHVIDLMMRNQMRRQTGQGGYDTQLHLPDLSVGLKPGDLELLSVHLVCDGDACKGPSFQICMRNNSKVPIGNFKVTAVGVLGQICAHSPTADICVPRIEPCQDLRVTLQLPVTCMAMGPHGQQAAFDTLIVALDSHDELLECDELNNVQILKRCDIVVVAKSTVTETTQSAPSGQPAPDSVPPQQTPSTPPQQLAPQTPQPTSPLDQIDVDQLQQQTAETALGRLR